MKTDVSKYKQEILRFRDLLKSSEDQLKQCEDFITSVNSRLKIQEEQIHEATTVQREEQMKYYLKLQNFDKSLMEVENCLADMARNQEQKL
jgi:hypothetical protein